MQRGSSSPFEVKPVASYEGPRYPAGERAVPEAPLEEKHHPLTLLLAMVMAMGISLGMIGCYGRSNYTPDSPTPPTPDGGPDGGGGDGGDGGLPPGCDEGELQCFDGGELGLCEDGEWRRESCEDICNASGGIDAYSAGCDATAEDPCLCMYDIVDGIEVACGPADTHCADDWTLATCDEYGGYTSVDCNTYCSDTNGPDWYSMGCDTAAEDPCQCQYGIVDGEMAMCGPGEVYCHDESTVAICDETGWDYRIATCDEYCVELHGEGFTSPGCDDSAEEPCQCEDSTEPRSE